MTVLANSSSQAEGALDAAFAELERVEQVMSLYRPASQVSQLNRDGRLPNPHPYLCDVLSVARAVSERTHGAFDVTVQPLWDLNAQCRRLAVEPSEEQRAEACQCVDWRCVEMSHRLIRLRRPARQITLNGIAQGFAADRVLDALRTAGIQHALVNTGEIGALGRSDVQPWRAGVQHPRHDDAYAAVVPLDGRSLSTSGDYSTTFTADYARHHIFDPRTGASPQELASVSILAPSGVLADALSTAAMVLGARATLDLIRAWPDVDACLIFKSGDRRVTAGFPLASV